MTTWSDLTYDILEHITSFLPFPDHYRFGAVCKNWRLVIKQKQHPPTIQLPWLVLDEDTTTKKRKFYSLSENKLYSIDIPELQGRYICGSSYGWLFAIDTKIDGILINPFTREFYELPPFPPFIDGDDLATLVENVPDGIEDPGIWTFAKMQTSIVYKAILSHDPKDKSDYTAMILYGHKNSPAFWRPGDSSWTLVEFSWRLEDVIYFKENFYAISSTNELHVVDFEPNPKLRKVGPQMGINGFPKQRYLLEFKGNILVVERFCKRVEEDKCITVDFSVMEPNLEEHCLYYWYDFDMYTIFLSRNSTIFVNSDELPQCKRGGIYFTHLTQLYCAEKYGCHDIGYYDMIEEKVSTFYPFEVFPPRVGSPIWLTPNPS